MQIISTYWLTHFIALSRRLGVDTTGFVEIYDQIKQDIVISHAQKDILTRSIEEDVANEGCCSGPAFSTAVDNLLVNAHGELISQSSGFTEAIWFEEAAIRDLLREAGLSFSCNCEGCKFMD